MDASGARPPTSERRMPQERVECRVRMQPLRQADGTTYGALLLMEVSAAPDG